MAWWGWDRRVSVSLGGGVSAGLESPVRDHGRSERNELGFTPLLSRRLQCKVAPGGVCVVKWSGTCKAKPGGRNEAGDEMASRVCSCLYSN